MVSMINKISSMNTPVPGLVQDDSDIPYCNANHLPQNHDNDIVTGAPVYYCPHAIQLELDELYEVVLIDDKGMCTEKINEFHTENLKRLTA